MIGWSGSAAYQGPPGIRTMDPSRAASVVAGLSRLSTVADSAAMSSAGPAGGSAGMSCTAPKAGPAATRNSPPAWVSPGTVPPVTGGAAGAPGTVSVSVPNPPSPDGGAITLNAVAAGAPWMAASVSEAKLSAAPAE